MKRDIHLIVATIICLVVVSLVAGCGSGPHGRTIPVVAVATFVGRAVCAVCHSEINENYGLTAHGQDFTQSSAGDLIHGFGGACRPCHVTGWMEESGYQADGTTPQLEGIGCEECHGRGSNHAAGPTDENITHHPRAENTCWDCHVSEYKLLDGPPRPTTDADLRGTAPGSVHIYHSQAGFLLGWLGYNRPITPSPHSLVEDTCVTCHLSSEGGEDHEADSVDDPHHGPDALEPDFFVCANCHGSAEHAQEKLEEFRDEIKDMLIELAGEDPSNPGEPDPELSGGLFGAFVAAHSIDLDNNTNPDDPFVKRYKGARSNVSYVESSGGETCAHNPDFARQLLEDAKDLLTD